MHTMIVTPIPSQEDLQKKYINNLNSLSKIGGAISGMKNINQDQERLTMLSANPSQFNQRQQQLAQINPWIIRQNEQFRKLLDEERRLQKENGILSNDFKTLYWRAIDEWINADKFISNQTQNLIKWTSLWELESSWFALWQATKRGWSESMKAKVRQDIESQWEQQRAQIRANDAQQRLAISQQKQQNLMWVWGQLQQQAQQDFQNNITLDQIEAQKKQLQQRRANIKRKQTPTEEAIHRLAWLGR